jgi:K(+)-stimulated pyrophosphate-energized sodium pump
MDKLIYLVPVMGAIGLLYTFVKFNWVAKQDPGTDRMKEISNTLQRCYGRFEAEWRILGISL